MDPNKTTYPWCRCTPANTSEKNGGHQMVRKDIQQRPLHEQTITKEWIIEIKRRRLGWDGHLLHHIHNRV